MGRRYGDFSRLHKKLRVELPGKVLPPMPKKNKQSSTAANLMNGIRGKDDDDASSLSSVSTTGTFATENSMKNLTVKDHRKSASLSTIGRVSPRNSVDGRSESARPGFPGPNGQVSQASVSEHNTV